MGRERSGYSPESPVSPNRGWLEVPRSEVIRSRRAIRKPQLSTRQPPGGPVSPVVPTTPGTRKTHSGLPSSPASSNAANLRRDTRLASPRSVAAGEPLNLMSRRAAAARRNAGPVLIWRHIGTAPPADRRGGRAPAQLPNWALVGVGRLAWRRRRRPLLLAPSGLHLAPETRGLPVPCF